MKPCVSQLMTKNLNRWNINFYMIEKQLVYLIAAHSQLNISNSEVTLKQIVKTITQAYPKIDFNILLELGEIISILLKNFPHVTLKSTRK